MQWAPLQKLVVCVCIPVFTVVLNGTSKSLFAESCQVVKHRLSEGGSAFLAGNYAKAAELYRATLAVDSSDVDSISGLVHTLLRQQKVSEAFDALKQPLSANPTSSVLLTLRGEVELRAGTPWTAAETVNLALKSDSCNARTHWLLARIAQTSFLFATARKQILIARQLDPDDPDIHLSWITTLPLKERAARLEAFLATPTGFDAEDRDDLWRQLSALKRTVSEPHSPCRLVGNSTSTALSFRNIMANPSRIRAFGLDVKLNERSALLEIDTGAGGLLISRSIANHARLKPFAPVEISGIGDKDPDPGYSALVDSIRIGDFEFKNCPVHVVDNCRLSGSDGIIGMNIFAQFLVSLDYPAKKLLLTPLPPRPEERNSTAPGLNLTPDQDTEDSLTDYDEVSRSSDGSHRNLPEPHDRYVPPEMKDYTKVFHVGPHLLIPTRLNGKTTRLFILDTGAFTTTISLAAANEVSKVVTDNNSRIGGA
jgi:Tfp pilus assembly protein PilF/predicted aspartyl protease